jgi:hypothetical protein
MFNATLENTSKDRIGNVLSQIERITSASWDEGEPVGVGDHSGDPDLVNENVRKKKIFFF